MEKLIMENIREIIKLKASGETVRSIARILNISRPCVNKYITAMARSKLNYQQSILLNDDDLYKTLFEEKECPQKFSIISSRFEMMESELKKCGVTRYRLWEEYRAEYPDGYAYSQFCFHFQEWVKNSEIAMHMNYISGDKIFIDFAGVTFPYFDGIGGEKKDGQIFVAVLPASGYTYVEAFENQKTESWIKGTEGAFWFLGGCTKAIVPDCAKAVVQYANKYEPLINKSFSDFAMHYDAVVIPARPKEPRDKALVENAVGIVYRRIFAKLRNQIFYSLAGLNCALQSALKEYNDALMQKTKMSRTQRFENNEKSFLNPLPLEIYEIKNYQKARAGVNYFVYLKEDKHYYSVPFRYRKEDVNIIYTSKIVEIYWRNERIASHLRDKREHEYTTKIEHLPEAHRSMMEWNPERFISWGKSIGDSVELYVMKILESRAHPELAYKSCFGLLTLSKKYEHKRMDTACAKGIRFNCYTYSFIKKLLENKMENLEEPDLFSSTPEHKNIRGNKYFEEIKNEQQQYA